MGSIDTECIVCGGQEAPLVDGSLWCELCVAATLVEQRKLSRPRERKQLFTTTVSRKSGISAATS